MAARPTEVTLSLDDCEPNALPPVCAKCGAAATCEKRVWFLFAPLWLIPAMFVGVLLATLIAGLARFEQAIPIAILIGVGPLGFIARWVKRDRTGHMPVCEQHQGIWNWGTSIVGFSFLAFPLALMAGTGLVELYGAAFGVPPGQRKPDNYPLVMLIPILPLGIGVLFGSWVHLGVGVRPSRITKGDLTLVAVAPAFAEAVEAQQDAEDAAYAATRAAKRKPV